MKMIQKALVSFNGDRDPHSVSQSGALLEGPILTILKARNDFDKIILFSSRLREKAEETRKIIGERWPRVHVSVHELDIPNPTSYARILKALRDCLPELCTPDPSTEYYVCVSPGTPQMHACWLLLTASGEFPAKILQVVDPRHLEPGQDPVLEIHPRGPEFPDVIPRVRMEEVPEVSPAEMEKAIRNAGIVGRDPVFVKALEEAGRVAQYDRTPILILGETGTGKELFAKYIQNIGKRRGEAYITVNCAAFPENLIESELFGYVKDAFTGANQDREGKFHAANHGTLFLDEIGDMSLSAQAKVLRALENGEITRVGAVTAEKVDVQIIAATNKDIHEARREKAFREDLYRRLSVMVIPLPSLAERKGDIPLLAQELLRQCTEAYKKNAVFSQSTLTFLQSLPWPGNIRELRNVIKLSVILARQETIEPADLRFDQSVCAAAAPWIPEPREGFSLEDYLKEIRAATMDRALEIAAGNQTLAAKLLGLSSQAVSQYVTKKRGD